jgi:hypothetical protein
VCYNSIDDNKEEFMSFNSLKKEELFRTAVEDFAVDVTPESSKADIITALAEDGVTWAMYREAHPAVDVEDEEPAVAPNVVTSSDVTGVVAEPAVVTTPRVKTRVEVNTSSPDLYLVKMDRDNPYFEFRGYKFTQAHPFAVMPADAADAILKREVGFKIASPSEAAEYYG